MGMRFRKSIKLFPGVKINISGSGISTTVGVRGASVTLGRRGTYVNLGLPGTGLSYRQKITNNSNGTQSVRRPRRSGYNTTLAGTGLSSRQRTTARVNNSVQSDRNPRDSESNDATERMKVLMGLSFKIESDGTVSLYNDYGVIDKRYLSYAWEVKGKEIEEYLCDIISSSEEERTSIENIYLLTPAPNTPPTFDGMEFPVPKPVKPEQPLYPPQPSLPEAPKESFTNKIIPGKRVEYQRNVECYEREKEHILSEWQNEVNTIQDEYRNDLSEWESIFIQWSEAKKIFDKTIRELKFKYISNIDDDVDIMQKALEVELQTLEWKRETIVSFEIYNNGEIIFLDVDLPEIEDFPQKVFSLSADKRKIVIKDKSKKQLRLEYAKHIHGIAMILAGHVFSVLPTSKLIVISGYSQRMDKATGNINDDYLYSIKFSREGFEKINFSNLPNISPVDVVSNFENKRRMTSTGVFKAITPYQSI